MNPYNLIQDYGLPAVLLTVLLEQFGFPLPSLLLLLIVGAAAVAEPMFGLAALVLATLASLVGGIVLFAIGRSHGERLLAFLCRISLSPRKCIGHGSKAYQRYGPSALIMARFVPGLATLAPPLAGSLGMPFGVFLIYQSLAAVTFSFFSLATGYLFDEHVGALVLILQRHALPVLYLLATAAATWLVYVVIAKRSR